MLWGFQKRAYLEGHLLESSTCCWSYQGRVALTHEVWDDFSPKTCWTQIMVPFQLWTHIIFNYSTFHTLNHLWIYDVLMLAIPCGPSPKNRLLAEEIFQLLRRMWCRFRFPVRLPRWLLETEMWKIRSSRSWEKMDGNGEEMRQSSPGNGLENTSGIQII